MSIGALQIVRRSDGVAEFDFQDLTGVTNPGGMRTNVLSHDMGRFNPRRDYLDPDARDGSLLVRRRLERVKMSISLRCRPPAGGNHEDLRAGLASLYRMLSDPDGRAIKYRETGVTPIYFVEFFGSDVTPILHGQGITREKVATENDDLIDLQVSIERQPWVEETERVGSANLSKNSEMTRDADGDNRPDGFVWELATSISAESIAEEEAYQFTVASGLTRSLYEELTAAPGENWTVSMDGKVVSGPGSYRVFLEYRTAGGALIDTRRYSATARTDAKFPDDADRATVSFLAPATTGKIRYGVEVISGAAATTYRVRRAQPEKSTAKTAYRTGVYQLSGDPLGDAATANCGHAFTFFTDGDEATDVKLKLTMDPAAQVERILAMARQGEKLARYINALYLHQAEGFTLDGGVLDTDGANASGAGNDVVRHGLLRHIAGGQATAGTQTQASWPAGGTRPGNHLLLGIGADSQPAFSPNAAWGTPIDASDQAGRKFQLYAIFNAASRSGAEVVTHGSADTSMIIMELDSAFFSPTVLQDPAVQSGSSGTWNVGITDVSRDVAVGIGWVFHTGTQTQTLDASPDKRWDQVRVEQNAGGGVTLGFYLYAAGDHKSATASERAFSGTLSASVGRSAGAILYAGLSRLAKVGRKVITTDLDVLPGRYRALARVKGAGGHELQLKWAPNSREPARRRGPIVPYDNRRVTSPGYSIVDLGFIEIEETPQALALELWHSYGDRAQGPSNLLWDVLCLAPADQSAIFTPVVFAPRYAGDELVTPNNPGGLSPGDVIGADLVLNAVNEAGGTPEQIFEAGRVRVILVFSHRLTDTASQIKLVARNVTDSEDEASITYGEGLVVTEEPSPPAPPPRRRSPRPRPTEPVDDWDEDWKVQAYGG